MFGAALASMEIDHGAGFIQLHCDHGAFFDSARFDLLAFKRKYFLTLRRDELDLILHETDVSKFACHKLMGPLIPFRMVIDNRIVLI